MFFFSFLLTLFLGQPFVLPSAATQAIAPYRLNPTARGVFVSAKSVLVEDGASQKILFAKNSRCVLPIASITKLVSVLVLLKDKKLDWQQPVIITRQDKRLGGRLYLFSGDKVRARDLLALTLIASSNQAIEALVRWAGYTDKTFAPLMNKEAQSLGMKHSHFVEPTGLNPHNVSTAQDLVKLARVAFTNPKIVFFTHQSTWRFEELTRRRFHRVFSTDWLLRSFLAQPNKKYYLIAAKTGHLDEAGYCFLSLMKIKGHPVIIALLHSASEKSRFQETKALAFWVYRFWAWH